MSPCLNRVNIQRGRPDFHQTVLAKLYGQSTGDFPAEASQLLLLSPKHRWAG
jgi:hypothetical protein